MKKFIFAIVLVLSSCETVTNYVPTEPQDVEKVQLILTSTWTANVCDYIWVQEINGNVIHITPRGETDTIPVSAGQLIKIEYRWECAYNRTANIFWYANSDTVIQIL